MRLALVVLFFVVLYFSLRPSPPAEPERSLSDNTTSQQQPGASGQTPPSTGLSPPEASTGTAPAPAEAADEVAEQPPIRSGETERAGEQHTSQRGDAKPGDVEGAMQKELTRLSCLSGRPERGWGARSRAALRRFVAKAKPKEGSTPSEALLHALRGYPENYCKSGGRPSRKQSQAAPRSQVALTPPSPQSEVWPELSYLPPWMVENGKVTQVEEIAQPERVAKIEEKVRTDVVAHTSPTAELTQSVRPKRRKRVVKRPRPAVFRSARRFGPPSLSGWPRADR